MPTPCTTNPLEFESRGRRCLLAKKLIFLLFFLGVPSWSFVPLRGYLFVLPARSWMESRRFSNAG